MEKATPKQEFTCQIDTNDSVSESVISVLAVLPDSTQFSATGWGSTTDPTTLYDAIDPDALDALFRGRTRGGHVGDHIIFAYGNYEIRVRRDGELTVRPATVIPADGTDE